MAWPPSPRVADCRDIAEKWGRRRVIILAWDDEQIDGASFGKTKKECEKAGTMLKRLYDVLWAEETS